MPSKVGDTCLDRKKLTLLHKKRRIGKKNGSSLVGISLLRCNFKRTQTIVLELIFRLCKRGQGQLKQDRNFS